MKQSDIVVDIIKTIGKPPYIACSSEPVFEFDNTTKQKTDNLIGYKIEIALPQLKLTKIGIKISTTKNPLPDLKEDLMDVDFTGLTLGIYTDKNGRIQVYGKADNVFPVNDNKTNIKIKTENN